MSQLSNLLNIFTSSSTSLFAVVINPLFRLWLKACPSPKTWSFPPSGEAHGSHLDGYMVICQLLIHLVTRVYTPDDNKPLSSRITLNLFNHVWNGFTQLKPSNCKSSPSGFEFLVCESKSAKSTQHTQPPKRNSCITIGWRLEAIVTGFPTVHHH